MPDGSSPASLSSNATTPCAGTRVAVKFLTAVSLLVWLHKSYAVSFVSLGPMTHSEKTDPDEVLSTSADPGRLGEVEGHIDRFVQGIELTISTEYVR